MNSALSTESHRIRVLIFYSWKCGDYSTELQYWGFFSSKLCLLVQSFFIVRPNVYAVKGTGQKQECDCSCQFVNLM